MTEAQTILIHFGAVSYCIHQLINRYQAAKQLLEEMSLSYGDVLEEMIDAVIEPVNKLLSAVEMNT